MTPTHDRLLREAEAIADGLSSVEVTEAHLIVMKLEIKRLHEKVGLLIRTIGMLEQLHPEELQKRLS
jgi:hypothetical protein